MEQERIQLALTEGSITINASMFDGVLATNTFEGPDCYLQLVNFLKHLFPAERIIHATIIVD